MDIDIPKPFCVCEILEQKGKNIENILVDEGINVLQYFIKNSIGSDIDTVTLTAKE